MFENIRSNFCGVFITQANISINFSQYHYNAIIHENAITINLKSLIEKNESIKEASIYARAYDEQFYTLMESRIINADIIILPNVEGSLSTNMANSYVALSSEDKFYSESNYTIEDKHYGIKLNSYSNIINQN